MPGPDLRPLALQAGEKLRFGQDRAGENWFPPQRLPGPPSSAGLPIFIDPLVLEGNL